MPGLRQVAIGPAGAGEAAVRAGLFQWRADLGREPESGGVARACPAGVTCPEENLTNAVERLGLHNPMAGLSGHGQGLLKIADSVLMAAESQVNLTEPDQGLSFAAGVAYFVEHGHGLPEVSGRLPAPAEPQVDSAEVSQHPGFPQTIACLAG
jgi:hypothetical protein